MKAFLSSPQACISLINNRVKNIQNSSSGDTSQAEDDIKKLEELKELLQKIKPEGFTKFIELCKMLNVRNSTIGWEPKKENDRVVVFTESLITLAFLEEHLREKTGLKADQVITLSGAMKDTEIAERVNSFNQKDSKVRVLLASDVASEGINLHHFSHRMIHFDIPWSLLTFQQRNGRIDRYGQKERPEIYYLLTKGNTSEAEGDMHVLETLIRKDEQAQTKVFSNPDALLYDDATANLRLTQRSVQGGLVRESLCLDKKVFDSVFAAIEIEDKKLVKESLTKKQAQDKAKKAWNYFFEIADIYQFANRFFMVAESAQSDPVYDEGVKEIEKLDVKDIHWKELIQEISSYSDHKLALEYIISELRQMGIPYVTESFAESWVPNGPVVAYPEGLVWRKDGRTLAIFPAESLYKDVKLPPETPELLVLTEKTDHWQGKVKKFFEETATQI